MYFVLMEETPPEMATNREFSSAFQPSLICHQFSSTLLYMMLIRLLPLVLGKEAEFVKSLRRTDQLTHRYAEVREATQQEQITVIRTVEASLSLQAKRFTEGAL